MMSTPPHRPLTTGSSWGVEVACQNVGGSDLIVYGGKDDRGVARPSAITFHTRDQQRCGIGTGTGLTFDNGTWLRWSGCTADNRDSTTTVHIVAVQVYWW
jgi:hypothetical protein